jgi:ubiquinone/menaquinone biosynthesis C-methylase UbiE
MNYDQTTIPAGYDRGRDHGPEVIRLWMDAVASNVADLTIHTLLDLGCGTGRFSAALSSRFDADVLALDPSIEMLRRAAAKSPDGRVHHVRASAEEIPLASGAVDAIFMSMSFHHFVDPVRAVHECRRLLRTDGVVLVRTGTRERSAVYPYVPFFPSSQALIEDLLPDVAGFRSCFARAGFALVRSTLITQTIAPDWIAYADKVAAGGDSVVARLDREELERGLAGMRQHALTHPDEAIVEPIDFLVFQ